MNDWISRLKFALLHDDTNVSALAVLFILCTPAIVAYSKGWRFARYGAFAFTAIAEAMYVMVFDLRAAIVSWLVAWILAIWSAYGTASRSEQC